MEVCNVRNDLLPNHVRTSMDRRDFVKGTAIAGLGTAVAGTGAWSAPVILTQPRTSRSSAMGELHFRPYYLQRGSGPHLGSVRSLKEIGEAFIDKNTLLPSDSTSHKESGDVPPSRT